MSANFQLRGIAQNTDLQVCDGAHELFTLLSRMLVVPAILPVAMGGEVLEDECRRGERERLLGHRAVRDQVRVVSEEARHGGRVFTAHAVQHEADGLAYGCEHMRRSDG